MTNPRGKRIYSALERTEDRFAFKARYAGRYQFCLTISMKNGLGVALGGAGGAGWVALGARGVMLANAAIRGTAPLLHRNL